MPELLIIPAIALIALAIRRWVTIKPMCPRCSNKYADITEAQLTGDTWIDYKCCHCGFNWRVH